MPAEPPIIDLTGYRRLHELERRLTLSPLVVAFGLLSCVGVAVLGFGLLSAPQAPAARLEVPLVGLLTAVAGAGGISAWLAFRLAYLKCPGCGRSMPRHVADFTEGERSRWSLAVEIDGRSYRSPLQDEHDRQPWVRLMKVVRVCEPCRAYLDCAQLHERPCAEDDWARLRQRFPNHERDARRREAWGRVWCLLWSGALLAGFFLLWWHSLR